MRGDLHWCAVPVLLVRVLRVRLKRIGTRSILDKSDWHDCIEYHADTYSSDTTGLPTPSTFKCFCYLMTRSYQEGCQPNSIKFEVSDESSCSSLTK